MGIDGQGAASGEGLIRLTDWLMQGYVRAGYALQVEDEVLRLSRCV